MDQVKIKIGGVPEHFNLPIHLAIEKGDFAKRGLEVEWTDYPGGTGQMTQALRGGDADVCVLLTEGIITDIINGSPTKIISNYVITPLIWGIHTGADNPLQHHEDIYDKRYAISRMGSGSHLMAIVDATSRGHKLSDDQFVIIKNLDGAIESLTAQDSDVFYWEKYTTKPLVDKGTFRRVGEFLTPWPCFVIAARDEILEKHPEAVIRMLRVIHDTCDQFMQDDKVIDLVAERYDQKPQDVQRWYHSTEWAIHGWVTDKMLNSVVFHLKTAGIVPDDAEIPHLVWERE